MNVDVLTKRQKLNASKLTKKMCGVYVEVLWVRSQKSESIPNLLIKLIHFSLKKFCREGRRASDGLVAQGILHSQSDHPLDSTVAFNSQRLHEACKAKGVLELHLLQREAAQLATQYQSNIPPDEMSVRQIQHSQFHVSPKAQNNKHNHELYHSNALKNADGYLNKAGDLAFYCSMKNDNGKIDTIRDVSKLNDASPLQKPPLQQQLMQHRLLQQKRQILQKQVALENGLSRRQMLRQQSYKNAQQNQIMPPLPLNEIESEDLLAFQAIVEGSAMAQKQQQQQQQTPTKSPCSSPCLFNGSPKIMKTSHIQQQQQPLQPPAQQTDCWSNLSGSMSTCQISENSLNDNNWIAQPAIYQVYYSNR